jgi:hypothetical protein
VRPQTVSQTGVGNSVPVPTDVYLTPFNVTIAVEVTGTVTYSVVWTTDDVWNVPAGSLNWNAAAANLTAQTTNQVGSLISPVTAVQLQVTAGTGTAVMRVIQAGTFG